MEKMDKHYKKETKADKKSKLPLIIVAVVVILAASLLITSQKTYIGGVSDSAKAYTVDDKGQVTFAMELPRGSEVTKKSGTAKLDKTTLARIEFDGKDYYVDPSKIVKGKGNLVQEKEVFVRTPVTVYKNEDGPEIASYMAKGSKMKVLDYDKMQDDGDIHKYKVAYKDSAGESGEGYVYGKYVEGTQEEADEVYNFHNEYTIAQGAKYGFELYGGLATNLDYFPYEKTRIKGKKFCKNAKTMYINTYGAVHPDAYLELLKQTKCNAVCIDVKDGQLTYKSEVAKEVSPYAYNEAYATPEDFKKSVKQYKDAGLYTIGRIVVFNDTRYATDHPEDCIVSSSSKNWPSAYSRKVWEYNIRLAQEAVKEFGFDEIQFDYVRFPESSYGISQEAGTDFRNKYGEEKAQAVQNFCFYAADQLREVDAYISVDVFGESSYGYVTAYGQYWPAISNIVDAISAMPYTDHMGGDNAWRYPYDTVYNWAKGAASQQFVSNPAAARTWITGYDTPYWGVQYDYGEKELSDQIRGLTDAGLKGGFIPWNVTSDIGKYYQYKAIWN